MAGCVGSLAASEVQILQQQAVLRDGLDLLAAPAAGLPKTLPPAEPVGQVLGGRLGDTGPEGPRGGAQEALWAAWRST